MGAKMTLTVEAVSGTKKGFKSGGTWYNRAKGANFTDFGLLSKGDVIEAVIDNGVWVKDFVVMSGGSGSTSTGTGASVTKVSGREEAIIRQSSLKAVLESPLVAHMFRDMDRSQAVSEMEKLVLRVTRYANTGSFDEAK